MAMFDLYMIHLDTGQRIAQSELLFCIKQTSLSSYRSAQSPIMCLHDHNATAVLKIDQSFVGSGIVGLCL